MGDEAAHYRVTLVEVNLDELAETRTVVVAGCFSITERF